MNWFFLAVGAVAFAAINNIIDKVVLEKYVQKVRVIAVLVSIAAFFLSIALLLIVGIPKYSPKDTLLLILAGVLQVYWLLPYFKALTLDDVTRVIPIFQLGPFVAMILSFVFLGEGFGVKSLIGFFFVLFGSVLVSMETFDLSAFRLRKAFWYMLLSVAILSFTYIIFKFVAEGEDFWSAFLLENIGTAFGGAILFLFAGTRKEFFLTARKIKRGLVGLVVINEVVFVAYRILSSYAVLLAPVALVTLTENTQPFFVFIYALLLTKFAPKILKEDFSRETITIKAVSLIIITIGVLLI